MEIFEYWQAQRESLRTELANQTDMNTSIYQIRKVLTQTEQNAFAELEDEIFRQQAGVLMSCVKNSVSLLAVNVVHQSWVAQKVEKRTAGRKNWFSYAVIIALLLILILGITEKNWSFVILSAIGLAVSVMNLLPKNRQKQAVLPKDEVKVTLTIDSEKLLQELDQQIRSVDRYLSDLRYLNEQLESGTDSTDSGMIARASLLMEAVSDCEDENREALQEAATGLLHQLGLTMLSYSADKKEYFSILPSKQVTRTITPAILSLKDGRLLKRGTAAVKGALGE